MNCKYCGCRTQTEQARERHEEKCLYGPMLERVKEAILAMSVDGRMPTHKRYNAKRDKSLPTGSHVARQIGWAEMAELVGLTISPRGTALGEQRIEKFGRTKTAIADVDREHRRIQKIRQEDQEEATLLIARSFEQGKRIYCWRRRRYVTVLAATL